MIATGLDFIRAAKRVRAHLGQDHRYAHVLRVARFAGALAARHGEDTRRARLAGMLHDLARLYTAERLITECSARGMPIDAFERANPIVLHARLGAELARDEFGVNDPAVLSAIAKHTVAGAEMSRLDTIVYLADGLEPGRDFANRAGYAEIAGRDLDAAMRDVLQSTIAYLRSRSLPIAPQTLAAANAFARPPSRTPSLSSEGGPAREVARGRVAPEAAQRAASFTGETPLPDLVDVVREAAEDKKAEDITILDLDGRTIVADTFVVMSGRSKIQTRSIADAITEKARENGFAVARTEGYNDGGWILIDLGPVVVHVFTPDQRQFYNLERLWGRLSEARAESS